MEKLLPFLWREKRKEQEVSQLNDEQRKFQKGNF